MIHRRSPQEIAKMQDAAKLLIETFQSITEMVVPGCTTLDIDKVVEEKIVGFGGKPAFKGYRGFPASSCISIEEVIVHGIPGNTVLEEGQIVGIDIGVVLNGYFSDCARTFPVGTISTEKQKLLKVTEECLDRSIKQAVIGNRISDIGRAVQTHAESNGFSVVREMVGHGIGTALHEEPEVPNYYDDRHGQLPRLSEGMVLAIEPMINVGKEHIKLLKDGWTIITEDKAPSAHFEHTVAITKDGPLILTLGR